jgi:hypothetical protein
VSDAERAGRPDVRYAAVEFEGDSRRVRRVVTGFVSLPTAELYAVEQGWPDFAIGPSATVTTSPN